MWIFCGFYIFALPFNFFRDIQLLSAFFVPYFVTVLTCGRGEGEAIFHVNRCSKLADSGLTFDP